MHKRTLFLGLDIGTTNIKAILYDPDTGQICGPVARADTPSYEPRRGWHEYEPRALWDAVRGCIRSLVERLAPGDGVEAIAAASMGEAGTLYNADGEPLCPIIAWHDPRTKPQRDWWAAQGDPYDLYRVTGQHLTHIFSANKLMWIRENWPEAWARAVAWRCIEDGVIWQLCGAHATDYTIASRTMLLDQASGAWATDLLAAAGIPTSWLPELGPSGRLVGHMTRQAAAQTGLMEGTPVVTGGHDHLCAALACGCLRPGAFLDSTGTSEAILWITGQYAPTRERYAMGYSHYRHAVPGSYVMQSGLDTGGAFLRWAAELLGLGEADSPATALVELAHGAPPGAGGVTALPFLLGRGTPNRDPNLHAALAGLALEHTRAHVARACVEALGFWLAENLEALGGLLGGLPAEIIATGGGNASDLVPQIKADAAGIPVFAPRLAESAALGAALLAAIGAGRFVGAAEAQASLRYDERRYEPNDERHALYQRLRAERYRALSDARRAPR